MMDDISDHEENLLLGGSSSDDDEDLQPNILDDFIIVDDLDNSDQSQKSEEMEACDKMMISIENIKKEPHSPQSMETTNSLGVQMPQTAVRVESQLQSPDSRHEQTETLADPGKSDTDTNCIDTKSKENVDNKILSFSKNISTIYSSTSTLNAEKRCSNYTVDISSGDISSVNSVIPYVGRRDNYNVTDIRIGASTGCYMSSNSTEEESCLECSRVTFQSDSNDNDSTLDKAKTRMSEDNVGKGISESTNTPANLNTECKLSETTWSSMKLSIEAEKSKPHPPQSSLENKRSSTDCEIAKQSSPENERSSTDSEIAKTTESSVELKNECGIDESYSNTGNKRRMAHDGSEGARGVERISEATECSSEPKTGNEISEASKSNLTLNSKSNMSEAPVVHQEDSVMSGICKSPQSSIEIHTESGLSVTAVTLQQTKSGGICKQSLSTTELNIQGGKGEVSKILSEVTNKCGDSEAHYFSEVMNMSEVFESSHEMNIRNPSANDNVNGSQSENIDNHSHEHQSADEQSVCISQSSIKYTGSVQGCSADETYVTASCKISDGMKYDDGITGAVAVDDSKSFSTSSDMNAKNGNSRRKTDVCSSNHQSPKVAPVQGIKEVSSVSNEHLQSSSASSVPKTVDHQKTGTSANSIFHCSVNSSSSSMPLEYTSTNHNETERTESFNLNSTSTSPIYSVNEISGKEDSATYNTKPVSPSPVCSINDHTYMKHPQIHNSTSASPLPVCTTDDHTDKEDLAIHNCKPASPSPVCSTDVHTDKEDLAIHNPKLASPSPVCSTDVHTDKEDLAIHNTKLASPSPVCITDVHTDKEDLAMHNNKPASQSPVCSTDVQTDKEDLAMHTTKLASPSPVCRPDAHTDREDLAINNSKPSSPSPVCKPDDHTDREDLAIHNSHPASPSPVCSTDAHTDRQDLAIHNSKPASPLSVCSTDVHTDKEYLPIHNSKPASPSPVDRPDAHTDKRDLAINNSKSASPLPVCSTDVHTDQEDLAINNTKLASPSPMCSTDVHTDKEDLAIHNTKPASPSPVCSTDVHTDKEDLAMHNNKPASQSPVCSTDVQTDKEDLAINNSKPASPSPVCSTDVQTGKEDLAMHTTKLASPSPVCSTDVHTDKEDLAIHNSKPASPSPVCSTDVQTDKEDLAMHTTKLASPSPVCSTDVHTDKEDLAINNTKPASPSPVCSTDVHTDKEDLAIHNSTSASPSPVCSTDVHTDKEDLAMHNSKPASPSPVCSTDVHTDKEDLAIHNPKLASPSPVCSTDVHTDKEDLAIHNPKLASPSPVCRPDAHTDREGLAINNSKSASPSPVCRPDAHTDREDLAIHNSKPASPLPVCSPDTHTDREDLAIHNSESASPSPVYRPDAHPDREDLAIHNNKSASPLPVCSTDAHTDKEAGHSCNPESLSALTQIIIDQQSIATSLELNVNGDQRNDKPVTSECLSQTQPACLSTEYKSYQTECRQSDEQSPSTTKCVMSANNMTDADWVGLTAEATCIDSIKGDTKKVETKDVSFCSSQYSDISDDDCNDSLNRNIDSTVSSKIIHRNADSTSATLPPFSVSNDIDSDISLDTETSKNSNNLSSKEKCVHSSDMLIKQRKDIELSNSPNTTHSKRSKQGEIHDASVCSGVDYKKPSGNLSIDSPFKHDNNTNCYLKVSSSKQTVEKTPESNLEMKNIHAKQSTKPKHSIDEMNESKAFDMQKEDQLFSTVFNDSSQILSTSVDTTAELPSKTPLNSFAVSINDQGTITEVLNAIKSKIVTNEKLLSKRHSSLGRPVIRKLSVLSSDKASYPGDSSDISTFNDSILIIDINRDNNYTTQDVNEKKEKTSCESENSDGSLQNLLKEDPSNKRVSGGQEVCMKHVSCDVDDAPDINKNINIQKVDHKMSKSEEKEIGVVTKISDKLDLDSNQPEYLPIKQDPCTLDINLQTIKKEFSESLDVECKTGVEQVLKTLPLEKRLTRITYSNGQYTCELCGVSAQNTDFLEHLVCHRTISPFYCFLCKQYFETRVDVLQHIKRDHPDDTARECGLKGTKKVQEFMRKAKENGSYEFSAYPIAKDKIAKMSRLMKKHAHQKTPSAQGTTLNTPSKSVSHTKSKIGSPLAELAIMKHNKTEEKQKPCVLESFKDSEQSLYKNNTLDKPSESDPCRQNAVSTSHAGLMVPGVTVCPVTSAMSQSPPFAPKVSTVLAADHALLHPSLCSSKASIYIAKQTSASTPINTSFQFSCAKSTLQYSSSTSLSAPIAASRQALSTSIPKSQATLQTPSPGSVPVTQVVSHPTSTSSVPTQLAVEKVSTASRLSTKETSPGMLPTSSSQNNLVVTQQHTTAPNLAVLSPVSSNKPGSIVGSRQTNSNTVPTVVNRCPPTMLTSGQTSTPFSALSSRPVTIMAQDQAPSILSVLPTHHSSALLAPHKTTSVTSVSSSAAITKLAPQQTSPRTTNILAHQSSSPSVMHPSKASASQSASSYSMLSSGPGTASVSQLTPPRTVPVVPLQFQSTGQVSYIAAPAQIPGIAQQTKCGTIPVVPTPYLSPTSQTALSSRQSSPKTLSVISNSQQFLLIPLSLNSPTSNPVMTVSNQKHLTLKSPTVPSSSENRGCFTSLQSQNTCNTFPKKVQQTSDKEQTVNLNFSYNLKTRRFSCDLCKKTFETDDAIRQHLWRHLHIESNYCKNCMTTSTNKEDNTSCPQVNTIFKKLKPGPDEPSSLSFPEKDIQIGKSTDNTSRDSSGKPLRKLEKKLSSDDKCSNIAVSSSMMESVTNFKADRILTDTTVSSPQKDKDTDITKPTYVLGNDSSPQKDKNKDITKPAHVLDNNCVVGGDPLPGNDQPTQFTNDSEELNLKITSAFSLQDVQSPSEKKGKHDSVSSSHQSVIDLFNISNACAQVSQPSQGTDQTGSELETTASEQPCDSNARSSTTDNNGNECVPNISDSPTKILDTSNMRKDYSQSENQSANSSVNITSEKVLRSLSRSSIIDQPCDSNSRSSTPDTSTDNEGFYKCGVDNCKFQSLDGTLFKTHLSEDHKYIWSFPCSYCGFVSNGEESYFRHMVSHTTKKRFVLFRCSVAKCRFATNLIQEFKEHHEIFHPKEKFTCGKCREEFPLLEKLLSHLQSNVLKFIQCPYCSVKDHNRRCILKHIAEKHPGKPKQISVSSQLICEIRHHFGFQQEQRSKTKQQVESRRKSSSEPTVPHTESPVAENATTSVIVTDSSHPDKVSSYHVKSWDISLGVARFTGTEDQLKVTCTSCSFVTDSLTTLIDHLNRTECNRILESNVCYFCRDCGFNSTDIYIICSHLYTSCKVSRDELLKHLKFHCNKCGFDTLKIQELAEHLHVGTRSSCKNLGSWSTSCLQQASSERSEMLVQQVNIDKSLSKECDTMSTDKPAASEQPKLGAHRSNSVCGNKGEGSKKKAMNVQRQTSAITDNDLRCKQCSYSAYNTIHLEQHVRVHSKTDRSDFFSCLECPEGSNCLLEIKKHMAHHPGIHNMSVFYCNHCPYSCNQYVLIVNHLQKHGSFGILEISSEYREQTVTINSKLHKCPECTYSCATKEDIIRHSLTHDSLDTITSNIQIKCPGCAINCDSAESLSNHMRRNSKKCGKSFTLFICRNCSYCTTNVSYIDTHLMEKLHEGYRVEEKTVRSLKDKWKASFHVDTLHCMSCSFTTENSKEMKQHLGTHTDEQSVGQSEQPNDKVKSTKSVTENSQERRQHKETHEDSVRQTTNSSMPNSKEMKQHEETDKDEEHVSQSEKSSGRSVCTKFSHQKLKLNKQSMKFDQLKLRRFVDEKRNNAGLVKGLKSTASANNSNECLVDRDSIQCVVADSAVSHNCIYSNKWLLQTLLDLRLLSSKENVYKCSICGYQKEMEILCRHVCGHLQLRPHKCAHCAYGALEYSKIVLHAKNKHPHYAFDVLCEKITRDDLKKIASTYSSRLSSSVVQVMEYDSSAEIAQTSSSVQQNEQVKTAYKCFDVFVAGIKKHKCVTSDENLKQCFLRKELYQVNRMTSKIICNLCDLRYETWFDIGGHLCHHFQIKPHKCFYCSFDSIKYWKIKSHIKLKHPNNQVRIINVPIELETIEKCISEFKGGGEPENTDQYVCPVCNSQFANKLKLVCHLRARHSAKGHFCFGTCKYVSLTADKLQKHIEKRHPDSESRISVVHSPSKGSADVHSVSCSSPNRKRKHAVLSSTLSESFEGGEKITSHNRGFDKLSHEAQPFHRKIKLSEASAQWGKDAYNLFKESKSEADLSGRVNSCSKEINEKKKSSPVKENLSAKITCKLSADDNTSSAEFRTVLSPSREIEQYGTREMICTGQSSSAITSPDDVSNTESHTSKTQTATLNTESVAHANCIEGVSSDISINQSKDILSDTETNDTHKTGESLDVKIASTKSDVATGKNPDPWKCDLCKIALSSIELLQNHVHAKHKHFLVVCKICRKVKSSISSLREHHRKNHSHAALAFKLKTSKSLERTNTDKSSSKNCEKKNSVSPSHNEYQKVKGDEKVKKSSHFHSNYSTSIQRATQSVGSVKSVDKRDKPRGDDIQSLEPKHCVGTVNQKSTTDSLAQPHSLQFEQSSNERTTENTKLIPSKTIFEQSKKSEKKCLKSVVNKLKLKHKHKSEYTQQPHTLTSNRGSTVPTKPTESITQPLNLNTEVRNKSQQESLSSEKENLDEKHSKIDVEFKDGGVIDEMLPTSSVDEQKYKEDILSLKGNISDKPLTKPDKVKKSSPVLSMMCELCGLSYNKKHIKYHIFTHFEYKPFGCKLCEYKSLFNRELKVHFKKHHAGSEWSNVINRDLEFEQKMAKYIKPVQSENRVVKASSESVNKSTASNSMPSQAPQSKKKLKLTPDLKEPKKVSEMKMEELRMKYKASQGEKCQSKKRPSKSSTLKVKLNMSKKSVSGSRRTKMETKPEDNNFSEGVSRNNCTVNKEVNPKESARFFRKGPGVYGCKMCSFDSSSKKTVLFHFQRAHLNKPRESAMFVRKSPNVFGCKKCPFETPNKKTLYLHFNRLHAESLEEKCLFCDFTAISRSGIKHHISKKHSELDPETSPVEKKLNKAPKKRKVDDAVSVCSTVSTESLNVDTESVTSESSTRRREASYFLCHLCPLKVHGLFHFRKHLANDHKGKFKYLTHALNISKCAYCDFTTYDAHELAIHHKKHVTDRPFKCGYCDFSCFQRCVLRRHQEKTHEDLPPKILDENHSAHTVHPKQHASDFVLKLVDFDAFVNLKDIIKSLQVKHSRPKDGCQPPPKKKVKL